MKPIRPVALAVVATAVLLVTGVTTSTAGASSDDPPKPARPAAPGVAAPLSQHFPISGPTVTIPAGGFAFAMANCPSGLVPTGGGGRTSSTSTFLTDSAPTATGWEIGVRNTSTGEASAYAYVVCTAP
ncbi:hypothetical protein ACFXPI_17920 [Streptomyces sp. NPDC059104]|uniref:hypothetical protein n=1 Tax=unclassified Streptomyces TaxID=2593676 RepID=UPI00339E03DE